MPRLAYSWKCEDFYCLSAGKVGKSRPGYIFKEGLGNAQTRVLYGWHTLIGVQLGYRHDFIDSYAGNAGTSLGDFFRFLNALGFNYGVAGYGFRI